MHVWTKEEVIEALRRYERETGKRATTKLLDHRGPRPDYMPGQSPVVRLFGTVGNAFVEAYGETGHAGGTPPKDDDTRQVIEGLKVGRSLKSMADERGITGQALGRRVARYKRVFGDE